jgi:hypothetical protein
MNEGVRVGNEMLERERGRPTYGAYAVGPYTQYSAA